MQLRSKHQPNDQNGDSGGEILIREIERIEDLVSEIVAFLRADMAIYQDILLLVEHKLIREALEDSAGNITLAAKNLGLNRTTLVEKRKRFGLANLP